MPFFPIIFTRMYYYSPRNPEGLTSVWVGNVVPEVNEKQLTKIFNK